MRFQLTKVLVLTFRPPNKEDLWGLSPWFSSKASNKTTLLPFPSLRISFRIKPTPKISNSGNLESNQLIALIARRQLSTGTTQTTKTNLKGVFSGRKDSITCLMWHFHRRPKRLTRSVFNQSLPISFANRAFLNEQRNKTDSLLAGNKAVGSVGR